MEYMKQCSIGAHKAHVLMKSPSTCTETHERACQRCWEKHLSNEVEVVDERGVRCLFCLARMNREDLGRLARKGTVERYDAITQAKNMDESKHLQCPDRCLESRIEPDKGQSSRWQQHEPEIDGRIFTCRYCQKQTCVPCDRPEHNGMTCMEYRRSLRDNGSHTSDTNASLELLRALPKCPECSQPYDHGGGCAYFQCGKCKHRFCGECSAPWTGASGEYAIGKLAHAEECRFRVEDPHPNHSYRSNNHKMAAAGTDHERSTRAAKRKAAEEAGVGKELVKRSP